MTRPTLITNGHPAVRIGFYAPLKAPDHPVPSGDRTMARALLKALDHAGHAVTTVSHLRSFVTAPHPERMAAIMEEAAREKERILGLWAQQGPPDVWFTYHNHYKAPDLLGPPLAKRFSLPFVMAEASHAPKRAASWGCWHTAAETASRAADMHLCFTARDRAGLESILGAGSLAVDLPPFIDLDPPLSERCFRPTATFRMVTVAMMRPGDKLASYTLLAGSLQRLEDQDWHLDVIGDGSAREEVKALFSALPPERVTWHGMLERAAITPILGETDLFVWPGFGEAFGLAYLEAQAAGLPVVALHTAGVPAVVKPGLTGILVEDSSAAAFADVLGQLMADRAALSQMGKAARRFVQEERALTSAARRIDEALRLCRGRKVGCHG